MNSVRYLLVFSIIYYFNAFADHFPITPRIQNSDNQILLEDYWYQKARFFNDLMDKKFLKPNSNKASIGEIENARDLVDSDISPLFKSVTEIHEKGLSSSQLKIDYWTGSYWSMEDGLLGGRLADIKFLRQRDWQGKMEYVKSNPAPTYVPKKTHLLSPSEKYELLIGDSDNTLTSLMWKNGQVTSDKYGYIFPWIGMCDGMSLASINSPRPKKSVTLWSIDGKNKIKFYPEDIKALGTLLWTQAKFPFKWIGERCRSPLPRVDANGRYSAPECFDTNPGTFHMMLANQIGRAKRSFGMDSTAGYEVWNFPIIGYDFKYFNPQTLTISKNPKETIVPIREFTNDKFSQTRAPNTAYIVGVEAKVDIVKMRYPAFLDLESSEDNLLSDETFKYDLELDQNGNIIGGEWYTHEHPDFLWIVPKGVMAKGPFDYELQGDWDPKKELFPEAWVEPAIRSSGVGIVPSQIVNALFELSSQEGEGFNPN